MKFYARFLPAVFFIFTTITSLSQDTAAEKVIEWKFGSITQSGEEYTLVIKGKIEPGWKLFSTKMKDDEPNSRISLDSTTSAFASIDGIVESDNLQLHKEPVFDNSEIKYFEKEAEWHVKLHVKDKGEVIKGILTYMAYKGQEVMGPEEIPFRFSFDASGNLVEQAAGIQESAATARSIKRESIDINNPAEQCGGTGTESNASKSLWGIFFLGFLGGLVALIMPCTFPMIPLTVSFFTKKAATRSKGIFNASMYGFFIFLIYVLLSIPFYFLDAGSSDILNNISTNAWLNVFFATVFLVFAVSFFGYFEISLPSSMTNTVDAKSNQSSLGGIFFMALTLAIVSFSCTGPILGSLLVGALNQDGGAVQLSVAMAGFGIALGLPFALFALFPHWLSSLPKSGGWMNSIKIVFGFIELALAIKFLSNADLVEHWGVLKREVFFAIWIIVGICLVLYLFGILKFKHDPPPPKLGKLRIGFALIFLAFTIYLLPGVTKTKYANLSLISGFPPPLSYSIYGKDLVKICGVEPTVINNYEKALQLSIAQNKPVLIDFTGWACVNCRKMEENVWPDPSIKELIEKNFILVSLYVDDREMLPETERFLYTSSDGSKKKIATIGDKYATFQDVNFRVQSQPYYVIVNGNEKLLTNPVAYTPVKKDYENWLRCGLKAFKETGNKGIGKL
ncbi:MAG: cytochrome c biogenesis protein CcdA [Chitinophagaceae bacterium]